MDIRKQSPEDKLGNLYMVARKKAITFTKREAAKWVGGRYVLEDLVARKKIRMEKPGDRQNSRWECNGEDVLRNAVTY